MSNTTAQHMESAAAALSHAAGFHYMHQLATQKGFKEAAVLYRFAALQCERYTHDFEHWRIYAASAAAKDANDMVEARKP